MNFILVALALLGGYVSFIKWFKVESEFSLFFLVTSIIFVLYWAAYFNILLYGAYAVIILGLLGLLTIPFVIKEGKDALFSNYITPLFIIILFYAIILSFCSYTLHFKDFDILGQWGPHAKYLFLRNGFVKATDTTNHLSYPPGGRLFYYLFYLFGAGFSEGSTYVAQQLLMLFAVAVVLKNGLKKNCLFVFIAYSALLLFLRAFSSCRFGFEGTLAMDCLTGVFFGCVIVCYHLSNKQTKDILWLLPPIFVLSLCKAKIYPIVLFAIAIIFVDQLLQAYFSRKLSSYNIKLIVSRIISLLLLPCSLLLAVGSWRHYLLKAKIPVEWKMHFSKSQIINLLLGRHLDHRALVTLHNYKAALLSSTLPFLIGVLIAVILIFILLKDRKERSSFLLSNIAFFFLLLVFLSGLLLMYLYSFGAYEGEGLTSFHRYTHIFCAGWSLYLFAMLFKSFEPYKIVQKKIILWPLSILVLGGVFFGVVNYSVYHHRRRPSAIRESHWQLRQNIRVITNQIKRYVPKNAKIFSVWQNSMGYSGIILRYEMIPWHLPSRICHSFVKARPKTHHMWGCIVSKKQFLAQFKGFNYLLLAYTDKPFWEMFGKLFPAQPPKLKPLVEYQVCMGKSQFNPVLDKPCYPRKEKAYLFKIIRKNGRVRFEKYPSQ